MNRTAFILLLAICISTCEVARSEDSPSFRHEIVPLLTRYGCNAGACHGKLAGQNGFRLSLRGFALEDDHTSLTRDLHGRRLNQLEPEQSLLLRKASGRLPHRGGRVLSTDSPGYQRLLAWIRAGAPGPVQDERSLEQIEVSPSVQTVSVGQKIQLHVTAFFSDGSTQDVTWLCQFFSSDENVAHVSRDGAAEVRGPGEATLRVHFQQQVQVVILTSPYPHQVEPHLYTQRFNAIDDSIFDKLNELHLPPAPLCDDATFLRRACLDTIGTLPTPDETRRFLADGSSDKRARLVEELLSRTEWLDYWTLQIADLLQNRKERDHDVRGAKGVRTLHAWIHRQLSVGRSWRDISRDVLLASGDATTHPEVGYYIVTVGERRADESEVVAGVAQSFLGTRIGCAQCHNHPLERYTQDDYYHFAAFFSRISFERKSPNEGNTVLVIADNHEYGLLRRIDDIDRQIAIADAGAVAEDKLAVRDALRKEREQVQRELAAARERPVQLRQPRTGEMLAPQPLDRSIATLAVGQDPRLALVEWITAPANEYFAGNMVNRLWKHFFSVGLVEPVDDIRASNPPSNRRLWELLRGEFAASNYDLKHVMRLILNSRAYQSSSETSPENAQDRRFYSHYYARRLPAEVLLDAISSSTAVSEQFPGYPRGMRAIQIPDPSANSYFLSLFGRSPRVTACACERSGDVALSQLLHMQNGDWISGKLRASNGWLTAAVAQFQDPQQLVEEMTVRTLCRLPTGRERQLLGELLEQAKDRNEAAVDIFWALLNTKEFTFNH